MREYHQEQEPGKETSPTERELKFAILKEVLQKKVAMDTLPKLDIVQSYFPKEIARLIAERMGIAVPEDLDIKNARIRAVDGKQFFFTIKGPKSETTYDRFEEEKEITESEYQELLPLATDGSLHKTRYLLDGRIDPTGTPTPIHAEIDWHHEGGGKSLEDLPFVTIDIEIPDEKSLNQLIQGDYQFDSVRTSPEPKTPEEDTENLLHTAVEITGEQYKFLGMRTFAKGKRDIKEEAQLVELLRLDPNEFAQTMEIIKRDTDE